MAVATGYHGFLPYQNFAAVLKDRSRTGLDLRNRASCGIFSVHHAMVFLGQGYNFRLLLSSHPRLLDKLHRGTVTDDLVHLAKSHELKAAKFKSHSIAQIRKRIDGSLNVGHAVIVGSEPSCHWICLGGRTEDGGYVWADSAENPGVGAFDSWTELEHWMSGSNQEGGLTHPFEIIAVSPGAKMPASRSMVPWTGSIWTTFSSDPDYAKDWSNLLTDMLDVFWDHDYAPKGRPAGEFLDEHLESIVEATAHQTAHAKKDLRAVGLAYRDAADFHNLVVAEGQDAQAIAGFSLKLAAKSNHHRQFPTPY